MRIRVMQALYAFHTGAADEQACYDLNLKEGIDELREREAVKGDKGDALMMETLYHETLKHTAEFDELVERKAANWELERIALIDRILMHMALVELTQFPEIPPKVSINEYIEIAKKFSTPKSSKFINGILDASLLEFRQNGTLNKSGRGLIDETTPDKKKVKRGPFVPKPAGPGGKPFKKFPPKTGGFNKGGGGGYNKGGSGGYNKYGNNTEGGGGYKKYNNPNEGGGGYNKYNNPNEGGGGYNKYNNPSEGGGGYNKYENQDEPRPMPKKEGRPRIQRPFTRPGSEESNNPSTPPRED